MQQTSSWFGRKRLQVALFLLPDPLPPPTPEPQIEETLLRFGPSMAKTSDYDLHYLLIYPAKLN